MASSTQGTRVWANSRDSERQGSLVCCSPWGRNELDTTEQLNKNTKKQPSSTASERISNIWFSIAPERNISQPLKGRKPCDKLQYGWTVNTLCWLTLGSDIRQPQCTNTLWLHFYDVHRAAIFTGTESRMAVARAVGGGNGMLFFNGSRASVWEDERVLEIDVNIFNTTELYT